MTSARATDRTWSKKTYRLSEVALSPSINQVIYHLKDGLERVFIKEELMLIPEEEGGGSLIGFGGLVHFG